MIDPHVGFSDEETRQILARAADRQEQAERLHPAGGTGQTLGALQEIARDASIDPVHVEAAAKEVLLRRTRPPVKTRLGLPLELRAQRIFADRASDAQWERIVADLRRTFRKSGNVSQFGPIREWISENEASSMPIKVRLEPVDEGTLATLHQPTKTMSDLLYLLGGSFSGVAAILGVLFTIGDFAPSVLLLPLVFFVLAVLSSLGAWGGYRAWVPRQEERFHSVLDRIELIARAE